MSRSVAEWIGRTPDTPVPKRVKVRVFGHYHGRCCCGCGRVIRTGEAWETDHIIAVVNGGENRERNLHPLLVEHHKAKTRADVAVKSKTYERRAKHLGLGKRSGFQTNRGGKFKQKMDGTVVRRK